MKTLADKRLAWFDLEIVSESDTDITYKVRGHVDKVLFDAMTDAIPEERAAARQMVEKLLEAMGDMAEELLKHLTKIRK